MILDKADASSTEIDDAASALKTAIDSLVEIGDVVKTELERVIAEAQSIDTTKYTDKTVDVLKTALVNAISINGNENATQEEVNAAITALTNAIDELELKTDVSVDKTDLETLLNICGTIDLNNYQENGKAEFKAAYEYALSIFNEADATEQEIRDAMNRLLEAKKNLKEIEVTPTDPDKNGQDKPIDNKVETGDNINVLYSASGLALASIVFYFSKKRKRSN